MGLKISSLAVASPSADSLKTDGVRRQAIKQQRIKQQAAKIPRKNVNLDHILQDLVQITQAFNKQLKFSVNRELEQVVVKVIDSQTDKVIKEIPPEEIQRLHVRIKEALGLLFDQQI